MRIIIGVFEGEFHHNCRIVSQRTDLIGRNIFAQVIIGRPSPSIFQSPCSCSITCTMLINHCITGRCLCRQSTFHCSTTVGKSQRTIKWLLRGCVRDIAAQCSIEPISGRHSFGQFPHFVSNEKAPAPTALMWCKIIIVIAGVTGNSGSNLFQVIRTSDSARIRPCLVQSG